LLHFRYILTVLNRNEDSWILELSVTVYLKQDWVLYMVVFPQNRPPKGLKTMSFFHPVFTLIVTRCLVLCKLHHFSLTNNVLYYWGLLVFERKEVTKNAKNTIYWFFSQFFAFFPVPPGLTNFFAKTSVNEKL